MKDLLCFNGSERLYHGSIISRGDNIFKPLEGKKQANGVRYPLVGGTRQRRFAGTSFEPSILPENAATPTSRVHAVLGSVIVSYP